MDQRALLAAKHLADMKAPQTGEWGPLLWKILHWMSLKVGVQKSKILQDDETNSWSQLFKGLGNILPCALCRTHYKEYYTKHIDIKLLKTCGEGEPKRLLISKWLYDLHENVNERKNVNSGITFESLDELYKDTNFNEVRTQFSEILLRALQQNIVAREHVLQWKTIISQLYGIYR
jgi:hypothetical protein